MTTPSQRTPFYVGLVFSIGVWSSGTDSISRAAFRFGFRAEICPVWDESKTR